METDFTFEHLDIDEFEGDAGKVARTLRAQWQLPPGPVQNVVRVIESAGGIILLCDFGTNRIDAISQWLPGMPPLFLINKDIPADRLRWTLTHELGHVIMHRAPTDTMEREADQFAAEFLMPEREIKPELYGLTLAKLASLKPHWRVSMNALLRRAGDLETISPRTKQYLWTQMGMRGYRTHEPIDIPSEKPEVIGGLFDFHLQQLGFGIAEMTKLVYLSEEREVCDTYAATGTFGTIGGMSGRTKLQRVK